MHVFANEDGASKKAKELGADMKIPVFLVDRSGDIVSRFDPPKAAAANVPPPAAAPPNLAARPASVTPPKVTPKMAKPEAEMKPEPKIEKKVEAKPEPKIEKKPEPKVEAKPEPKPEPKIEKKAEPVIEAKKPAPEVEEEAKPVTLKVGKHDGEWAVLAEDMVITTSATRSKAREVARKLREDPDFLMNPHPIASE
jgi:hypothetical protein